MIWGIAAERRIKNGWAAEFPLGFIPSATLEGDNIAWASDNENSWFNFHISSTHNGSSIIASCSVDKFSYFFVIKINGEEGIGTDMTDLHLLILAFR